MNKLFSFIVLVAVTKTALANCPRTRDQLICPGDTVMSSNGWTGVVLGINPHKRKAGVRWQKDSNGYSTRLRGTYSINTLSLGVGCVSGYCVGDDVVSSNGWSGEIVGVNPFTNQAGVRWKKNSNGHSTRLGGIYAIRNLSLGLGCVSGYCVGDEVVSSNGWTGEIIGVNSFQNKAGVRWKNNSYGHPTSLRGTYNVFNLSNAKFCDDYGSYQRSMDSYPKLDETLMIDLDFKFSIRRPVKK